MNQDEWEYELGKIIDFLPYVFISNAAFSAGLSVQHAASLIEFYAREIVELKEAEEIDSDEEEFMFREKCHSEKIEVEKIDDFITSYRNNNGPGDPGF